MEQTARTFASALPWVPSLVLATIMASVSAKLVSQGIVVIYAFQAILGRNVKVSYSECIFFFFFTNKDKGKNLSPS